MSRYLGGIIGLQFPRQNSKRCSNGEYYDLFILDIEMPNLDGMELAKVIKEHIKNPVIIFLTSYTDYVYNAFEVEAFRFIPKENMKDKKIVNSDLETNIGA